MKIIILENGPYNVDGDIPLKEVITVGNDACKPDGYKDGKSFDKTEHSKYLCRCGHSGNMPFCDGQHNSIGFDGTETDNRKKYDDEAELVEGPVYDCLDNPKFCSGARFCSRDRGFWDAFENAHIKECQEYVEEIGCTCDSGRLTLLDKNGTKIEPDIDKEIYLIKDELVKHLGPIQVRGGIQIIAADGFAYEIRNRVTLCRCGASQNKPFCDGAHLKCECMEI